MPLIKQLAAVGSHIFKLNHDGSVLQSAPTIIQPHAWIQLGAEPNTVEITAGKSLYSCVSNRWIYRLSGATWVKLDSNPDSDQPIIQLLTNETNQLYLFNKAGEIWTFGNNIWNKLDSNPESVEIAASSGCLYKRHKSGEVWQLLGPYGRRQLHDGLDVVQIVARGGSVYERRSASGIWECKGVDKFDWVQIDKSTSVAQIATGPIGIIKRDTNGQISGLLRQDATWTHMGDYSETVDIVAGDVVYRRTKNDEIYRWIHYNQWQKLQ